MFASAKRKIVQQICSGLGRRGCWLDWALFVNNVRAVSTEPRMLWSEDASELRPAESLSESHSETDGDRTKGWLIRPVFICLFTVLALRRANVALSRMLATSVISSLLCSLSGNVKCFIHEILQTSNGAIERLRLSPSICRRIRLRWRYCWIRLFRWWHGRRFLHS